MLDTTVSKTEIDNLNSVVQKMYNQSKNAGWHDKERNEGEMLALIHAEISEALEGIRKDLMDSHLPYRKSTEVEMADAVIRIFDYCGMKGYDLGSAIAEKNKNRLDHKREERQKEGGKKF